MFYSKIYHDQNFINRLAEKAIPIYALSGKIQMYTWTEKGFKKIIKMLLIKAIIFQKKFSDGCVLNQSTNKISNI